MGKSKSSKKGKDTGPCRAPAFKWPGDLEQRFCATLEEYPCLWNSYEDSYTDRDRRPVALEEFGRLLNMTADEAKKRLKSIRNAYRRAILKKPKSGSAGDVVVHNAREKKLMAQLSFLAPHIKPMSTINNMEGVGESGRDSDSQNNGQVMDGGGDLQQGGTDEGTQRTDKHATDHQDECMVPDYGYEEEQVPRKVAKLSTPTTSKGKGKGKNTMKKNAATDTPREAPKNVPRDVGGAGGGGGEANDGADNETPVNHENSKRPNRLGTTRYGTRSKGTLEVQVEEPIGMHDSGRGRRGRGGRGRGRGRGRVNSSTTHWVDTTPRKTAGDADKEPRPKGASDSDPFEENPPVDNIMSNPSDSSSSSDSDSNSSSSSSSGDTSSSESTPPPRDKTSHGVGPGTSGTSGRGGMNLSRRKRGKGGRRSKAQNRDDDDDDDKSYECLRELTAVAKAQLAEIGSDDALWAKLLVKRLVHVDTDSKNLFKAYVDKICCDLLAGRWKPEWDTPQVAIPPIAPSVPHQVKQTPAPQPRKPQTPQRRPPAQVQDTPPLGPTAALGNPGNLPPNFRIPPNATTAYVYRGRPTAAAMRDLFGTPTPK